MRDILRQEPPTLSGVFTVEKAVAFFLGTV